MLRPLTLAIASLLGAGLTAAMPTVAASVADPLLGAPPAVDWRAVGVGSGARSDARLARVARLIVDLEREGAPADGRSAVRAVLRLLDADGQAVRGFTRVWIDAGGAALTSRGQPVLRSGEPSDVPPPGVSADAVAVEVEGGEWPFSIEAPTTPGERRLRVFAEGQSVEGALQFWTEQRPAMAFGLVEGVVSLRDRTTVFAPTAGDAFEREIRTWARRFDGDRGAAAARVALFYKGTVRGDALLTASFDSDKDTRDRLLRQVQPDRLYPVYGDDSTATLDAPSSGRLYLRLDQGRDWLLYGDFTTADPSAPALPSPLAAGGSPLSAVQLGRYQRNATGVRAHREYAGVVLDGWATNDRSRLTVEEFASLGSGPYALRGAAPLAGSERVEVVTRDRFQPARVLGLRTLVRGADYGFEPFSGRILLAQPLAAFDAELNPLSLRISYENEQAGDAFWAGGAQAQWRVAEPLELGAGTVSDRNPLAPYRLDNVNATLHLGPRTRAVAELAQSDGVAAAASIGAALPGSVSDPSRPEGGKAARLELAHEGEDVSARLSAGRSSPGFDNPAAPLRGGRDEGLAEVRARLDGPWSAVSRVQVSADRAPGGGRRDESGIGLQWRGTPELTVEGGWRRRMETVGERAVSSAPQPFGDALSGSGSLATGAAGGLWGLGTSAIDPNTGLSASGAPTLTPSASLPAGTRLEADLAYAALRWAPDPRLTVRAEAEAAMDGDDQQRLSAGADWRLSARSRLYARAEEQRGWLQAAGATGTGIGRTAALGAELLPEPDTRVYGELRQQELPGERQPSVASGARRDITWAPGWRAGLSYERLQALSEQAATADSVGLALDWRGDPLWRGNTRIEHRRSADRAATSNDEAFSTTLWTATLARRLDDDFTLVGRQYRLASRFSGRGDVLQDRSQMGLAWRGDTERLRTGLLRLEHKTETDSTQAALGELSSRAWIVGAHAETRLQPWALGWSGRLAGKWQRDQFEGGAQSRFRANLAAMRLTWDVAPRLDLGAQASVQWGSNAAALRALGLEGGWRVQNGLWLSVGWNAIGYRADADLVGSEATQRGVYLRLRWKFDETLWATKNVDTSAGVDRHARLGG